MAVNTRFYGWIPDLPDHRDHRFAAPPPVVEAAPPFVDLRPLCPPILLQRWNDCTVNSSGSAFQFEMRKQGLPDFSPSRLALYYGEREIEGTINSDPGAFIRDAMRVLAQQGAAPEHLWPYDADNFTERPSDAYFAEAEKHQVTQYLSVPQERTQIEACLAAGFPVVFGFTVYESFESDEVARTGIVPLPDPGERVLGGHAVLLVGYDRPNGIFIVRNSWGANWGMAGYFTMRYSHVLDPNLADSFWTVRVVEGGAVTPGPAPVTPAPITPTPPTPGRTLPAGGVSVTPATIFRTAADVLILEDGEYRPFRVTDPGTELWARNVGGATIRGSRQFSGDEPPCGIRVEDNCDGFTIDGVNLRGSYGRGLRVTACKGVQIRNVESFDHSIESIILGDCPGAVIEDVNCRDSSGPQWEDYTQDKRHGLYISGDASGTKITNFYAARVTGSGIQANGPGPGNGDIIEGLEVHTAILNACGIDGTPALSLMGVQKGTFEGVEFVDNNADITLFDDGQGSKFACYDNTFEKCKSDGAGKWTVHEEAGSARNHFVDCEGLP